MKTSKILAVILAAMLMLTLLTATVFAETTGTGESADVTGEATGEITGESTGESTEAPGTGDETTKAPASETTKAPASETTAGEGDDHDHSINWIDIIVSASILVLGVAAFVICYFAIPKFRAKVQKFISDYKSELKKVTWSSKQDVKRNTITVIVIVAVLAIVIALLDIIFSGGIDALSKLF